MLKTTRIDRIALFVVVLLAIIALCFLCGCAGTRIFDRTGKKLFETQADADLLEYESNGTKLRIVNMNHSYPTIATGRAINNVVGGVGSIVTAAGATTFLK